MTTDTKQSQVSSKPDTVTFTIDGRELTVPKGTLILAAAQKHGIHIPNFCYHPKLKSVGSCRMCYVEIEGRRGLAVSCSTEATEGAVVRTTTDIVKKGRKAILEFILANHPLDCPTCDKGGECDLQDLTFAHGIDDSRFDFQKYRFVDEGMTTTFDDLKIGPEIVLNRNRCILCYKCVRANKEAFGEFDLGAYERGNVTQINAAPGQEVDNPYSGNLVEICPVGALTNTDWRYKVRVWLTQTVDSICPYSSSGANIRIYKQEDRDRIFRITSRRNDAIDDGWLADVTRYGYQVTSSEERLRTPLIKKDGKQVPASWDEALAFVAKRVSEIRKDKGSVCLGGWISPSLDNRTLHAFNKFMRKTIGSNNVDYRQDYRMLPVDTENRFFDLLSQTPSIADIDDSDVILTIGTDLLREHQGEYLRIRKAVTLHNATYFSVTPYEVKAGDVARAELIHVPGTEEVVLTAIGLAAVEEQLVEAGKAAEFKSKVSPNSLSDALKLCGLDDADVRLVARALASGKKLTVFGGEMISRSCEREIISAALCNLNLLFDIQSRGQVAILSRMANSKGAEKLGLTPAMQPALKDILNARWNGLPDSEPATADRMLRNMKKEELDGLFIIGANPAMLYPDRAFAREGLERLVFLVVCDLFETETTALADVVLPLSSWAEHGGSYVNLEGRVQTTQRAVKPRFQSRPGYEIVSLFAEELGETLFDSNDQLDNEIAALLTIDSAKRLPDKFHEVKFEPTEDSEDYPVILYIGDDAHHCGHWTEKCSSLTAFCGEATIEMSVELAALHKIKTGDAVRVESENSKIVLPARISERLEGNIVFIPRNFSSSAITSLINRKNRLDRVRIRPVTS